ncbi:MAG: helix-turn-helix domain-containing protein [Candidatus Omnitrophica bacterium]|nr:helix-turn-helix domain-containing protein [Candidatus Omnitrophota bacterium]
MNNDWDLEKDGLRLRKLRTRENWSRMDLAEKLKVSQQTIYNWETGSTPPSKKNLLGLQSVFGDNAFTDSDDSSIRDVNALGSWLLNRRTTLGLTRSELADQSGLTYQTIYNLETGVILNPQQSTRSKLESALKAPIPEDVEADVAEDADLGVTGVGPFTDLRPHDIEGLPEVPGIYVLYDISDRPIYVGESQNIKQRISNHHTGHVDKFWYRSPIVETGAYVRIDSEELRKQIEAVMIRFLKSNAVVNKQHVDR